MLFSHLLQKLEEPLNPVNLSIRAELPGTGRQPESTLCVIMLIDDLLEKQTETRSDNSGKNSAEEKCDNNIVSNLQEVEYVIVASQPSGDPAPSEEKHDGCDKGSSGTCFHMEVFLCANRSNSEFASQVYL